MSEIVVYASFPNEIHSKAVNLDPSNWTWSPCIQISADRVLHFSSRPYAWLRYAIGAIVGAHGHLAITNTQSYTPVDYLAPSIPLDVLALYYHLDDKEKLRMFPIDPGFLHERITSSVLTARRAGFREDVLRRDGNLCVVSQVPGSYCDAAHLSAHAKGDKYIQVNTQRRARSEAEYIANVDDLRNGLLLHPFIHRGLGKNVAFLVTPNFAMETSDKGQSDLQCVAHAFIDDPYSLGGPHVRLGTSVRICDDLTQWPPQILFDLVYASAVLVHFGTPRLREQFSANGFKDQLYPQGVSNSTQAEYMASIEKRAQDDANTKSHNLGRGERGAKREHRDELDAYDMIMFLPYINVGAEKMMHTFKEAEERAEAAERAASVKKVEQWRGHLE
ncbi:hypothetical protein BDN71DRAFT_1442797 [Pleurotus eryngii]|uniref:HNH nuclease domain-containing protein n=1 Tax=Pleurotus eryngii TaxID=5323 RepID=A0A9P6A4I7_PLEER|nr:hypothetical protein BDN71DRAFT_1442797 [Pleurotus eryngii]